MGIIWALMEQIISIDFSEKRKQGEIKIAIKIKKNTKIDQPNAKPVKYD